MDYILWDIWKSLFETCLSPLAYFSQCTFKGHNWFVSSICTQGTNPTHTMHQKLYKEQVK
jgi:hypothetical protein